MRYQEVLTVLLRVQVVSSGTSELLSGPRRYFLSGQAVLGAPIGGTFEGCV